MRTRTLSRIRELTHEMREMALHHVDACAAVGIDLLIYCGRRSLEDQARTYRRNRALSTIERKAERMATAGFPHLGQLLLDVGPQTGSSGRVATHAGPGESLHYYGLAYDCAPVVNGKIPGFAGVPMRQDLWDTVGELGESVGLEWAGRWRRMREMPHFQRAKLDLDRLMILAFLDEDSVPRHLDDAEGWVVTELGAGPLPG